MDTCPLLLTTLGSLLFLSRALDTKGSSTQTLTLLTLVPFFDSRPDAGWDRGIELLPMGRIARDEINEREDILPGYRLELIEADSDACGYPTISKAYVSFASNAIGRNGNGTVVGVTGLACSTVTAMLSPLAGKEEVSLIQMSMSNSPALRNARDFPHLWRTVSSSIVHVNATLALMDRFNWSKISTVFDENGIYYYATARALVSEVRKNKSRSVMLNIAIDESEEYIESAVDQIKSNGSRIIFVSSTPLEAARIMCAAKQRGLVAPGYQWIFHTHTLSRFVSNDDSECSDQEILTAMENVILLQWQLIPDDTSKTVYSGKTIKELQTLYTEELRSLSQEEQYSKYADEINFEDEQPWAYPLYDEVWAIALALNKSLPDLKKKGLNLADYRFGNSLVTETVEEHLAMLSFEGAVGRIIFDSYRETLTTLKIFQIRNGTEKRIGRYSKLEGLILYNASDIQVADDEFEEEYVQVPRAVRIILYLTNAVVVILTTSLLILTLYYRKSPILKADSGLLNSLVFIGCYCICVSSLAESLILEMGAVKNYYYYTALCNILIWCWSIGLCLILGTDLVKLVRIYQIFTHLNDYGWLLTSHALFIYVLSLESFPVVLLLIWSIFDTLEHRQDTSLDLDGNPPRVKIVTDCNCQYYVAWLIALLAYFTIMLLMLIFFAFQTRKIRLRHFKDTKKVMFFVVFVSLTLTLLVSGWMVLRNINLTDARPYASVAVITGNVVICLLCLGFLISPKVLPVFYQHITTVQFLLCSQSGKKKPK